MTDITTQSPAEIDEQIATLEAELSKTVARINRYARKIGLFEGTIDLARFERMPTEGDYNEASRYFAITSDKAEALREQIAPLNAEYRRRPWTRFFHVANTGGHIHSSMSCGTCFPTTLFSWRTELSGTTPEALVALVGETACTVCYPEAPTFRGFADGTSQLAKLDAAGKAEKAAEKDAKAAAKAEKAIFDIDGSPLFESPPADDGKGNYPIKTLVSARRRISFLMEWIPGRTGSDHLRDLAKRDAWTVLYVARAISAKTGESIEDLMDDAIKKANRKAKKAGAAQIDRAGFDAALAG